MKFFLARQVFSPHEIPSTAISVPFEVGHFGCTDEGLVRVLGGTQFGGLKPLVLVFSSQIWTRTRSAFQNWN
jgi:hypothetical protein